MPSVMFERDYNLKITAKTLLEKYDKWQLKQQIFAENWNDGIIFGKENWKTSLRKNKEHQKQRKE